MMMILALGAALAPSPCGANSTQHLGTTTAAATPSTYSAICAVGRDENAYVREWAEHHLCLGIGTIHLYDHESAVGMDGPLRDLIDGGRVTYDRFEGHHKRFATGFSSSLARFAKTAQGHAYAACLSKYGGAHTFVGFIDIDEFLALHDPKARAINDVLREYEPFGGVAFHWRVLGSSGHRVRPDAPVAQTYTACLPPGHELNRQVKSFVNTAANPVMVSPHRATFGVKSFVNTAANGRGDGTEHRGKSGGGQSTDAGTAAAFDPTWSLVDEAFLPLKWGLRNRGVWGRVAVYHFVTKSWAEFEHKARRGGGAGVTRNASHFHKVDKQATDTCTGVVDTWQRFCSKRDDQPATTVL
ncbi:hypothetical protein FOA52_014234 [Chlamydomonas sp. UWO 241]|nr:hypothetical protein FOA52_014234 [Chlamydomonas sp. UWO 241]